MALDANAPHPQPIAPDSATLTDMPNNKSTYFEFLTPFYGDGLVAAARMAETAGYQDYLLYESAAEWCLGFGVHSRLTVYWDRTILVSEGEEHVWENTNDLSQTIQAAMSKIPVRRWKAYGTVDFELARCSYGLDPSCEDKPLSTLFVPEAEVRIAENSILLRALTQDTLDALRHCLAPIVDEHHPDSTRFHERLTTPRLAVPGIQDHDSEHYMNMVEAALREIGEDKYRKIILSRRVPIPEQIDMVACYVAGRRANTPARSYLLRMDGLEAAGFSPETVAEVNDRRECFTTPLGGTRSLGDGLREELTLREELLSDSKEIAEHAISVYVAYDEMTMICDPREVAVSNFMIVARRGSVQHLASRLRGKLLRNSNSWHALYAMFPGVTASGVPKRSSVEAIGRLEPQSRGLYAGCVVVCDESGELDAALVLRTIFQQEQSAWLQAGAGIMNMSLPARELEETREKLRSCASHLIPADDRSPRIGS